MIDKIKYKFAVLGGDGRQAIVARKLADMGHRVSCFCVDGDKNFASKCEICASADKAMSGADFAILPLPVSKDGTSLSQASPKTSLSEIAKLAQNNQTKILGGVIPTEFNKACQTFGIEIADYYKRETLQLKNALPSAEGALMIAMEHSDITIHGMNTLICGYGRIGRILADILRKLGARVTVAARRDEVLCDIALSGYKAIKIGGETGFSCATDFDIIFNTVPSIVFSENVIKNIKNSPIYIEIASSPGGIDLSAARDAKIEIIHAPSLPGKYSPKSAGNYVYETVLEILNEWGIIL